MERLVEIVLTTRAWLDVLAHALAQFLARADRSVAEPMKVRS